MSAPHPELARWRVAMCRSDHPDALSLRAALSDELQAIVGDPGHNSFADWNDDDAGHHFCVGYIGDRAVTCGGLRVLAPGVGEVKRMYVAKKGAGLAGLMLSHIERVALEMGLTCLRLETRISNTRAIRFYEKSGFARIAPYGRYVGRADACCMEKQI